MFGLRRLENREAVGRCAVSSNISCTLQVFDSSSLMSIVNLTDALQSLNIFGQNIAYHHVIRY